MLGLESSPCTIPLYGLVGVGIYMLIGANWSRTSFDVFRSCHKYGIGCKILGNLPCAVLVGKEVHKILRLNKY